jgi:hypothetical protein
MCKKNKVKDCKILLLLVIVLCIAEHNRDRNEALQMPSGAKENAKHHNTRINTGAFRTILLRICASGRQSARARRSAYLRQSRFSKTGAAKKSNVAIRS